MFAYISEGAYDLSAKQAHRHFRLSRHCSLWNLRQNLEQKRIFFRCLLMTLSFSNAVFIDVRCLKIRVKSAKFRKFVQRVYIMFHMHAECQLLYTSRFVSMCRKTFFWFASFGTNFTHAPCIQTCKKREPLQSAPFFGMPHSNRFQIQKNVWMERIRLCVTQHYVRLGSRSLSAYCQIAIE